VIPSGIKNKEGNQDSNDTNKNLETMANEVAPTVDQPIPVPEAKVESVTASYDNPLGNQFAQIHYVFKFASKTQSH